MIASRDPFESTVLAELRAQSRVLEIGCGQGDLARTLAAAGHTVIAVDPHAPDGDIFVRTRIEEFIAPARSFDAIVAARSLHHLDDLDAVLDSVAALLHSDGRFIVSEFGWDRADARTLQWYFARWQAIGNASRKGAPPPTLEACERRWRDEHADLYGAARMLEAFNERFAPHRFAWAPYLSRELGDAAAEPDEAAAIAAGEIDAIGFFYSGGLLDVDG